MDDAERHFWTALEFRICAEFAGFKDQRLRHYWCDGLVPDEYDLRADEPRIRGLAYCGQSGQEQWRFTLLAGNRVGSSTEIAWATLLPPNGMTAWLSLYEHDRMLIIDPHSACPD